MSDILVSGSAEGAGTAKATVTNGRATNSFVGEPCRFVHSNFRLAIDDNQILSCLSISGTVHDGRFEDAQVSMQIGQAYCVVTRELWTWNTDGIGLGCPWSAQEGEVDWHIHLYCPMPAGLFTLTLRRMKRRHNGSAQLMAKAAFQIGLAEVEASSLQRLRHHSLTGQGQLFRPFLAE